MLGGRKAKFDLIITKSRPPACAEKARYHFLPSAISLTIKAALFILALLLVFANSTSAQADADLNGGGKVDGRDLEILMSYWLDTNCVISGNCEGADFEPDGDVDFKDYSEFSNQWNPNLAPVIEIEQSFLSIALQDGRVWDNGTGIGIGRDYIANDDMALRLGDWSGPLGYRIIVSFDTSFLPDDAVIVSARLEMTRGSNEGADPLSWEGNSCDIDIASPFGISFNLEISDWHYPAAATNVASFSYLQDPGQVYLMVSDDFNSEGLANINIDGKTQLRVYLTIPNNGASGNDYLGFYSGDSPYVTRRPKLIVQYTTRTPIFYSTEMEDGRVWDDGGGAGIDNDYTDNDNTALRLGDWAGPYGYKTILSFDTGPLPDYCEILSARLEMTRGFDEGTDPFTWEGNSCDIDIAGQFGISPNLENSDFEAPAAAINIASFSYLADPGGEQQMLSDDFNADGLSYISKTNRTQFRVYFTVLNNGPGGNDYLGFYSGDSQYPQKRPKLIISYE